MSKLNNKITGVAATDSTGNRIQKIAEIIGPQVKTVLKETKQLISKKVDEVANRNSQVKNKDNVVKSNVDVHPTPKLK